MSFWDKFKRLIRPTNSAHVISSGEWQGPPVPPPKPAFVPVDRREANLLAQLHPAFRVRLERALQAWRDAGLAVYVFEGLRTVERQAELFAKGRDANGKIVDKNAVVTNARPGLSYHAYCIAADIVFDGDLEKPGVQWSWNQPEEKWLRLGKIGQMHGLEWAGSWVSFKEYAHFQLPLMGVSVRDLLALYNVGGQAAVDRKITSLYPTG